MIAALLNAQDHRWDNALPSGLHLQRFSALIDPDNAYKLEFPAAAPQNLSIEITGGVPDIQVRARSSLRLCDYIQDLYIKPSQSQEYVSVEECLCEGLLSHLPRSF